MADDAPATPRVNPLTIPDDEPPEQTYQRLMPLARAELEAAAQKAAANGTPLLATATDGSLGTRHVWPSSDLDVMLVPEKTPPCTIEWGVRAGLVVHRHLNSWEMLTALRDNYPQSFVDTAAGGWIRDPTWMLDGLATLAPLHDPEGRLAALRDFVRERRFAPEVVLPRRSLLLRRAQDQIAQANSQLAAGDEYRAVLTLEGAHEALSLIWLEAEGRIISHKELDPELASVCAAQGRPGAHGFFRASAGIAELPHAQMVRAAVRHALEVFSTWLESSLDASPNNAPSLENFLPRLVYLRHHLWAASLAPARDCWLFLTAQRRFFTAVVDEVATAMSETDASAGAAFRAAIETVTNAIPLTTAADRLATLAALLQQTADCLPARELVG